MLDVGIYENVDVSVFQILVATEQEQSIKQRGNAGMKEGNSES